MILNTGEYTHIIHRQFFHDDVRRHFVGPVEGHEGPLVRAKGYLFAMDPKRNEFVRREQLRTRILEEPERNQREIRRRIAAANESARDGKDEDRQASDEDHIARSM